MIIFLAIFKFTAVGFWKQESLCRIKRIKLLNFHRMDHIYYWRPINLIFVLIFLTRLNFKQKFFCLQEKSCLQKFFWILFILARLAKKLSINQIAAIYEFNWEQNYFNPLYLKKQATISKWLVISQWVSVKDTTIKYYK